MSSGNKSSENSNGSHSSDHNSDEQKNNDQNVVQNDSKVISETKNCPICLNEMRNVSVCDTCLHEFCFDCIREWSTQHNHCPTCRQQYSNILYNIRSDTDFEQMPVESNDDTDMNAVLVRMFLFIQLIAIRNQIVDQRNSIDEQLRQLRRRQNNARCGNALNTIRQRIRNLQTTRNQMTSNINRLENTARILNPQQWDLLRATDAQNNVTNSDTQLIALPFDSLANNVLNHIENSDNSAGNETDDEDSEPESQSQRTTRRRRRRNTRTRRRRNTRRNHRTRHRRQRRNS